ARADRTAAAHTQAAGSANTPGPPAASEFGTRAPGPHQPGPRGPPACRRQRGCAARWTPSWLLSFPEHASDVPQVFRREVIVLEQVHHERLPRSVEHPIHEVPHHLPDDLVLRPNRPVDVRPLVLRRL